MKTLLATIVVSLLSILTSYGIFYGISETTGLTSYTDTGTPTALSATTGRALALDQTNSHIYIGTLTGVTRTDLNGNNAVTLTSEGSPIGGIALDQSNQKIYYTVDSTSGSGLVRSVNFDGTGATTLATSSVSSRILRQIDIDLVNQKMYWAEGVASGSGGLFREANLNGSNIQTLGSGSNPYGVIVDQTGAKLYRSLGQSGTVFKSDLDGSNSQTLTSALIQVRSLSGDYANDFIYYVYFGGSRLGRVNTDGTGNTTVFNLQSGTYQVVGDFAPIPEPSTYALILSILALSTLLWLKRSRK